jgi:hypothetical protein
MITFHSQQSDSDRHAHKNENSCTFNFTSQITSSICTVTFMKYVRLVAVIFTSRCSRMVMCYRLYTKQALPLIFIRLSRLANSSPTDRKNPARRSRNGGELAHKNSGEMSRSLPHNFPAIAGRWKSQCRRISARATRETTRNLARNHRAAAVSQSKQQTMQHPTKRPARRLVEVLASRFQP